MTPTHRTALLLASAALLAAAAPRGPFEMVLKDRDHASLGKKIGEYYEARSEMSGISEAKAELGEAIAKLDKKLEKKDQGPVLAMHDDLAASFAASKSVDGRPKTGKVTDAEYDAFWRATIEYAYHAPKGYKSKDGPVPLVLCIPDEGDEPGRYLDEDWNLPDLRNGVVLAAIQMPEDLELWGVSNGLDTPGGVEAVMFALRGVREKFIVDVDRIFLAGTGVGVGPAVTIAAMFPHIFAGVAGRQGDLADGSSPKNFRNLPCLFAGGGAKVTAFVDEAASLDYEGVVAQPDAKPEDVAAWILETTRNANPVSLTFSPAARSGSCYWVNIDGFDPAESPEITAIIDREKNAIAITSRGISTATLFFNDALVDMDREVTVVCNGVEHKDTFGRSLTTALDQYYNSNDWSRVYTAIKPYDLPDTD